MRGRLFLDLDGVLADFAGHYTRCFGEPPSRSVADPPMFWENIMAYEATGRGFYADLQPLPDALDLWYGAVALYGAEPCILTGIPRGKTSPTAKTQKAEWVRRYISATATVVCCHGWQKHEFGSRHDVLVDDLTFWRDKWEAMGGVYVLHETAPRTLAELKAIYGR